MLQKTRQSRLTTSRRLRHEPLDDRRMFAVIMVSTLEDTVDPSDGVVSLREAVAQANEFADEDIIRFDADLVIEPATIDLALGQINIEASLRVEGPGAELLSIDAGHRSRIFEAVAGRYQLLISGLELRRGQTTGDDMYAVLDFDNSGPALLTRSVGLTTLTDLVVSENRTLGYNAHGAIASPRGNLEIRDSIFTGNTTAGDRSGGSALYIYGGEAKIENTVFTSNCTSGEQSYGGAVQGEFSDILISRSTFTGNSTLGAYGQGGAISGERVTLDRSTVQRNSTDGIYGVGGGVWGWQSIEVIDSYVLDNSTAQYGANGGGLASSGSIALIRSSVAGNVVNSIDSQGSQIAFDQYPESVSLSIEDSVLHDDLRSTGTALLVGSYDDPGIVLSLSVVDDSTKNLLSLDRWQKLSAVLLEGDRIRVTFRHETAGNILVDAARSLTNPIRRSDVNGDGNVSALDALLIINELNIGRFSNEDGVVDWDSIDASIPAFLDQNGDGSISALDALRVINDLNRLGSSSSAATEPLVVSSVDRRSNFDADTRNDEAIALLF